ncbi:MAG: TRAP transporter substrate-binding protein [Deltaproteobacteria bacterium]|nr:TRAP transporter substrate-binding protein [Deltaproteobacteria bacterium]
MKKWIVLTIFMVLFIPSGITFAAMQMSVAYSGSPGAEEDLAAIQFKKWIEERTKGQIDVKLFGSEQLGKEVDIVSGLQLGSVDMSIMGTTIHEQAAPRYNIWSAYYIFGSSDEVAHVLNGPIGQKVNAEMLSNKGIRMIGYGLRGPRNLTSNRPIKDPKDVKGLKIRIPLQPIYVESWKELGAQPTAIAYGELYLALKQGVVDSQENPLSYIYTPAFYEVQKYVNVTEHQRAFFTYVVGEKFFQRLNPEQQKILIQTGKDITVYHNNLQAKMEGQWKQKLIDKGMTFVASDQAAFKDRLKDIPNKFASQWAPGLYQEIQKEIKEYRPKK